MAAWVRKLLCLLACALAVPGFGQVIQTVAGTGTLGFSGDGGAATSAQLYTPTGVAVNSTGELFIADRTNHRIRKVSASGQISTVAGTGVGGFGGDGGAAALAQLYYPSSVAVSTAGELFIADTYNHRIRKVSASGQISTVAGTGAWGFSGDGGPATSAQLDNPIGVAVNSAGDLFVADFGNVRIRQVTYQPPAAPTAAQATPVGSGQVVVSWTPPANASAVVSQYTATAQPGGQSCTATPPATQCTVSGLIEGQTYTFTVVASNSAGSTAAPAPSNPATALANVKAFSAAAPTGTGTVAVGVSGGGASCAFESVRLVPVSAAATAPPSGLQFPHGLLDFVLAGCDATAVTVTLSYPSPLPQGVQYWKLRAGAWAAYAGATATPGATTATLTLSDGGPGDADGDGTNGRIVDPGQVAVMVQSEAVPVPTLSAWGLLLLAGLLGPLGWRQARRA